MIKAVIFDYDLTVARTLRMRLGLLRYYSMKYKISLFWLIWNMPKFYGMSMSDGKKLLSKFQNIKITKESYLEYRKEYKKRTKYISINSPEVYAQLQKQVKIGIITNELKDLVKLICDQHKLTFDFIEDTSKGDTKVGLLKKTAKKLKLKPAEILYVGDHPKDIIAGKKAGTKTAAFKTILHTHRQLKKEKPDYILHTLSEIPDLIAN
jgi:HAD superfamily hydrolase (TIGR01549 family)